MLGRFLSGLKAKLVIQALLNSSRAVLEAFLRLLPGEKQHSLLPSSLSIKSKLTMVWSISAPEAVNLVFAKKVKEHAQSIKIFQRNKKIKYREKAFNLQAKPIIAKVVEVKEAQCQEAFSIRMLSGRAKTNCVEVGVPIEDNWEERVIASDEAEVGL
ncbi:hypothetical protein ACH5RR_040822 [Cinchona calisaya]|uniref:Uncharacterized protein n=1 Tax=Cinchona calisaya TaxID=153742 RepID=A0ABD2XVU8_9GENT